MADIESLRDNLDDLKNALDAAGGVDFNDEQVREEYERIRDNSQRLAEDFEASVKLNETYDEAIVQLKDELDRYDSIEEYHEGTREHITEEAEKTRDEIGRRGFSKKMAAGLVGGTALLAGAGAFAAGTLEDYLDRGQLQTGEWYSFDEVDHCLSEDQESTIEDNMEDPLDETSYKFERRGDSRSEGWNIYLADSHGQEELGVLEGQDINCEVD